MDSTLHRLFVSDSRHMDGVPHESVDLVVTSPPYPMVEMWDGLFSRLNSRIGTMVRDGRASEAFELMHGELDKVWSNCYWSLKEGGIACIVIGDATRTADGVFTLFSNHSRILSYCLSIGFKALPGILWRKQSNKPNKFMGSGMLPAGAYPTLEHEHILIMRKGGLRRFRTVKERADRRRSAFFWEERNIWFSDVWEGIKGERQSSGEGSPRCRNASFPLEIARRLILMFSSQSDTVLDPFMGSGTTAVAAAECGRNSMGYEIEPYFASSLAERLEGAADEALFYVSGRLDGHRKHVERNGASGGIFRHTNARYGFPVTTSQEVGIEIPVLRSVRRVGEYLFEADYQQGP